MALGNVWGVWPLEIHPQRPSILLEPTLGVRKWLRVPQKEIFQVTVAKIRKNSKKWIIGKIYKFFQSQNKSNFDMEIKQRIKGDVACNVGPTSSQSFSRKSKSKKVNKKSKSKGAHVEFIRQWNFWIPLWFNLKVEKLL